MGAGVRIKQIFDGAVGDNAGTAFTASLNEQLVSPDGKYWSHLVLSYDGDTSTAAVTHQNFLNLVNPVTVKVNGVPRIQIRGRDLYALQAAFLGRTPSGFVADTTNDDASVRGMQIPIWETVKPNTSYSVGVTRAAVTNVATEQLALASVATDTVLNAPLEYIEISHTTAGATGVSEMINELPRRGKLLGMLIFETTVPTNTATTYSVQRFFVKVNGVTVLTAHANQLSLDQDIPSNGTAEQWGNLVLDNYRFIDLRQSPIDLINNKVGIEGDVQGTSEAIRIIPIIQLPA